MPAPLDPDDLHPAARAAEVAEFLATGHLRHRALREEPPPDGAMAAVAGPPSETHRQRENDLEAPRDQSVHVPTARS